jgi:hypothetical protein
MHGDVLKTCCKYRLSCSSKQLKYVENTLHRVSCGQGGVEVVVVYPKIPRRGTWQPGCSGTAPDTSAVTKLIDWVPQQAEVSEDLRDSAAEEKSKI